MQDVGANISGPVDRATHRVLSGVSWVQALEVLRAQAAPLTVADVADRVGLHPNTVRLHLDQLVDAGLVAREAEPRDRPGRPRLVYAATSTTGGSDRGDHDGGGRDGYRLLAEILASHFEGTAEHAAAEATAAGRSWGRMLSVQPKPASTPVSAGQATDHLVQLLDELGFAPRSTGPTDPIKLRRCPFRQVAEKHSPGGLRCPPRADARRPRRARLSDAGHRARAVRHTRAVPGPPQHSRRG